MRDQGQRRIFLAVVMLMLLATVLSACAAPAGTGAPAAAAPVPTKSPEQAKTLSILYWQAPTILNSHQASGTKDFDAAGVILEPLARINEKDEYVPYLAAELPTVENGGVAADGTSVTWKLKPGVKWSDGSDFTADDVVFTWQYCADPATACATKSSFDPIANVEAVDPTTVKITWKEPQPNPFVAYTTYNGMILQKAQFANCIGANAISDADCQKANLAPIGTGAYKLEEFKPGDTAVYVRNENYRDADKVYFDKVIIKGGGDAASAARAVCETGEVDYAWNLQVQKAVLEPILAGGKCDSVAGGSFGVERVELNFSNPDPALGDKRSEPDQPHPILSDLKVRQAIAKAIDRQAIADQLYGPTGSATCNIAAAPAAIYSPNTKCERDVEGAKKLLEEAGWTDTNGNGTVDKDGKELVLSFTTTISALRQGEQAIIKENLAEIGIQVDLKAIDAGVFFGGDPGNPDTLNKFYADLQMYTNSPDSPDPAYYFAGWQCDKANSKANNWQGGNAGRYCNKDFDAAYAEFAKEFDPAKRAELAIGLNDMLVDDVAIIPLINRVTPSGKAKDIVGPTYNTFDSNLWNVGTWSRQEP
ncbi:MAG: peptide ABC transporter substrate-binding protein [Caldilineaceae bacterium]